MTKKLRLNIMTIMTILLSLTLIIIIVAINSLNYYKTTQEEDRVLEYYIANQFSEQQFLGGQPNNRVGQPDGQNKQPAPEGEANAPQPPADNAKPNDTSNSTDSEFTPDTNNPADNEFTPDTSNSSNDENAKANNDNPPPNDAEFSPLPYNPQFSTSANNSITQIASLYASIYVRCDNSGTIDAILTNHSTTYTKEELQNYCTEIVKTDHLKGTLDNLKYQKVKSKNGYNIAFINLTNSRSSTKNVLIYSILLGIIGIFIFSAISYLISGLMIKPVDTAFTRQEEFIAAASHELKTPLTVIQANSEIVEDQFGQSKWLGYIQTECDRMNQLISSLLTLAKLEQSDEPSETLYECNLSEAFMERILPFESVAFEKNYTFSYHIEPDIVISGIRDQLQQVLTTMVDNAFYHTTPNGHIDITLSQNNKSITLTVSNTGKPIPLEEQEKLFQRFYRADKARSRENGHFGLGLSIAKTIVEQHNGTIKIHCENGTTSFITTFRKN